MQKSTQFLRPTPVHPEVVAAKTGGGANGYETLGRAELHLQLVDKAKNRGAALDTQIAVPLFHRSSPGKGENGGANLGPDFGAGL